MDGDEVGQDVDIRYRGRLARCAAKMSQVWSGYGDEGERVHGVQLGAWRGARERSTGAASSACVRLRRRTALYVLLHGAARQPAWLGRPLGLARHFVEQVV
uniref:Uncharacterized protein n=1 Tax=Oryza meridionalis TaxID=40149 RepID=A0A0E0EA48_9ORYZ